MLGELSFHRWGDAQRTVNPGKVIVHAIEAGGMAQILDFLAEAIGQAGHAAHRHSHAQILTFRVARRDVDKLRITLDTLALHADAFGRAITRFGSVSV
jgi:hypothetical protein